MPGTPASDGFVSGECRISVANGFSADFSHMSFLTSTALTTSNSSVRPEIRRYGRHWIWVTSGWSLLGSYRPETGRQGKFLTAINRSSVAGHTKGWSARTMSAPADCECTAESPAFNEVPMPCR
jgi:hypothetical protein